MLSRRLEQFGGVDRAGGDLGSWGSYRSRTYEPVCACHIGKNSSFIMTLEKNGFARKAEM